MPIINQKWPRDICPQACSFGRTRNDIVQQSPRTRQRSVIRTGGRALWSAQCTWRLPQGTKLGKLRYWLESLEGLSGSAQIWDFAAPRVTGSATFTFVPNLTWYTGAIPAFWSLDTFLTLGSALVAGVTAIPLTGLAASTLVCVQGQYVQIGRRLYLCAATIVSDGAGAAVVPILGGLVDDAAIGTEIRFAEAACEMHLAEQSFDQSSSFGDGMTVVSATFIESVTDVT